VIVDLAPSESGWLSAFFAPPNELTWAMLESDAAPAMADQVRPWLEELARAPETAALVLPFVRGGAPIGWYAATVDPRASEAFASELGAWLGPSYLTQFERAGAGTKDARVKVLRTRFGGTPLLLSGATAVDNAKIAERLIEFAQLRGLRPPPRREVRRPVGRIRADFDRALLAQDERRATELLMELRNTGRLNEENLRYLEVRLQAGLGYWPQIARNHWLITTLSDLRPPPQTLADLAEALYRTFIEPLEASGDAAQLLAAFETAIARPYPRLFASRRGVRAPRVVKAFLLYERLRAQPTAAIVAELRDLLPEADRASPLFQALCAEVDRPARPEPAAEAEADAAFDDGEFDRAFELYIAGPMGRKTLNRLLLCGDQIGADARQRLAARLDGIDPELLAELSPPQQRRLAELRAARAEPEVPAAAGAENPWIAWALQLQRGRDLAAAERAVSQAPVTWDITSFHVSEALSARFADLIGNLNGEAAAVARRSVAALIATFFPPGGAAGPALRPVAAMLFLLLAMDDPLSRADLELLAQLVNHRLALGLAAADYDEMIRDLRDVQTRVASYATLPWSLDICEALAIAPAAGATAQEARLGFFMSVLGEARGLTHRLQPPDLVTLDLLAKDFQVQEGALAWLRQLGTPLEATGLPNLAGRRIGIYTLAEAAGARAKAALEAMYPGCRVEVNSDLVCTAQLASLAQAADLFVFAWKSSSHQAFYCVKDAMAPREPVWAAGKGTASILRAVADSFS
jgi:hypothetical protein